MPITFSGLASGLNTDQLITDLVRFSQKRIDALVKFGGGVDPGVWSGETSAQAESYATSVPSTD